ncbi:MAG: hypothetical protein WCW61_03805 [Patescibacteria group bacterium]|jgi:hypothetical protein
MSDIKDLPGAGNDFRVSSGAGNFSKKFSAATRVGNLHNLADNKASILRVIKSHEGAIKMGKFDRLRQLGAVKEVKKLEGNKLTKDDKKEIKELFKHLGSHHDAEEEAPKIKIQIQKSLDEGYEKERLANIKTKVGLVANSQLTGEARLNFASDPGFNNDKTDRESKQTEYKEVKQAPAKKAVKKINKALAKKEVEAEPEEEMGTKRFNLKEEAGDDRTSSAIINRVLNRHLKPRSDILKDRLSPKIFEPTKAQSYMADEDKKDRRTDLQNEKDGEKPKEGLNPEFFQNL